MTRKFKSEKNYYCPLNNYILHNIKRFMLDKPVFIKNLRMREGWRSIEN